MIAKAGLGVIGLGAISIGGVAVTKPHWLGMDYMPPYKVLAQEGNFTGTYSSGKFGNKYGKYLTSTTESATEAWWKWALRRWEKGKPKSASKFLTNIEKGYESSGSTALNQLCKDAYGQEENSGFKEESETGNDKFKKSEVWKYCSIGGTQPQTIQEFNSGKQESEKEKHGDNNTVGSDSAKQSKLLSIKSEDNKWIWDLKDKDFSSENITDGFFKVRKEEANRKSIKDICAEAYGEQENTSETGVKKVTKTDTEKYCSLTGTNN